MDWYGEDGLLIKPPVLQVFSLIQDLQIHQFFIQIQLVDDVTVSITLIEHIPLAFCVVRCLKDYLAQPVTLINRLNPISRIPFQDWILTHHRVDRHLKSSITDVQDFFQRLFHLFPESILLLDSFPDFALLVTVKIEVIHV